MTAVCLKARALPCCLAIERNRSISANQHAELTVWTRGPVLRAHEYAEDMYAAIDLAVDKLDRQVLRHKDRLKNHSVDALKRQQSAQQPQ